MLAQLGHHDAEVSNDLHDHNHFGDALVCENVEGFDDFDMYEEFQQLLYKADQDHDGPHLDSFVDSLLIWAGSSCKNKDMSIVKLLSIVVQVT